MQSTPNESCLIVIGASAGGVEALMTLVGTLPADLGAPVLIAQHMSRDRQSHLAEILDRRTTLPVRSVEDRAPLELGVIYVVPADAGVEIADHHVLVVARPAERPAPSIDLLLTTAAHAYGENLIAVILTGSGSDGASGARDVKAAGGTVIIQDPATAAHPEMPLALAPTTVDIAAQLESIGPLLQELVSGVSSAMAHSDDVQQPLRRLLAHVREYTGMDFSSYRSGTITRRLQRRMVAVGAADLTAYTRFAQRNPSEYQRLANNFLIKVTEFFRDPELFDYLRREVMPGMVQGARERGELRLWSAGCATGEEPYSLAMLVSEALGDDSQGITVRIFATDLDEDAINFARRGVYPASALAGLTPDLIGRYFTAQDGTFEVRKPLRNMVVFGQHDLSQRSPFPRIDMALCRNVLMYFTPELQKRALQLFTFALRDGGLLVLGKAETVSPLPEFFVAQEGRLKVFRRVGDQVSIPPARMRGVDPTPVGVAAAARAHTVGPALARVRTAREDTRPPPLLRGDRLVMNLPEGIVVVDQHYEMQFINVAARNMLGIHGTAIGSDLIHLVKNVPVVPLRDGIAEAFRGRESTVVIAAAGAVTEADDAARLELRCYPMRDDRDSSRVEAVVVHVSDVTEREAERSAFAAMGARLRRVTDAHEALATANDELTAANARLRAVNDELLLSNEEFQAATEEVETLNEEMQATNEELEALNEELGATVEELNTANEDLQARGVELQELAASYDEQRRASETERARLRAVLVNMSDAVVLLDADGNRVLTNDAFQAMFGGRDGVAPEDALSALLPSEHTPARLMRDHVPFTAEFTGTQPDGSRRWFEAVGQPIATDGAPLGVIVVREITDRSLRHLQDEFLALASHELRSPLTALSASLQLLRRRLGDERDDPRVAGYLTQALQQANQLALLVNDLVDVARLQTGRLRVTPDRLDLCELVEQTVEVARVMLDGRTIEFERPAAPVIVDGDAARLQQALLNLVTNAHIYAPQSERIDVRLRSTEGWAELAVQDYGPGIAAADLEQIFTRFFQTEQARRQSRSGLGLGLFIVREIVTMHGGTVDVASTEGHGTTFTVRLPLVDAAGATQPR